MTATIAVAGATGFTGRRVVRRLVDAGHPVRSLVRSTSDTSVLPQGVERVVGDLADPATLDAWLEGIGTVVYTASMGFGHIPGVIAALRRASVSRAVFVSTTAIFTRLPAPSKRVRVAAEEAVTESGLDWTIVRPTMIYGAPGDRNMERLLAAIRRWPILPVPGRGERLIQPVHVEDLADGIVATLDAPAAIRRSYDLSGREPLTFARTIEVAAAAMGRSVRLARIPLAPVCGVLGFVERLGITPPVKREQVLRLAEDKAFSHAQAATDLEYAPRSYEDGIAEEARLLGWAAGSDA